MVSDPHYGSSEYSNEAEEVFARFVLEHERGESPDFEALCEAHEELADELYGLHADWDNVRSLLARLQDRRDQQAPAAAPSPEPAQPASTATPESTAGSTAGLTARSTAGSTAGSTAEPTPEPEPTTVAESSSAGPEAEQGTEPTPPAEVPFSPEDVPDRDLLERRAGTWRRATVVAAVGAALLAAWALDLRHTGTVLAEESRELRAEGVTVRGALADAEQRAAELDADNQRLDDELGRTIEEREALAGRSAALEQDLVIERDTKRTLEERQRELARQLEAERQQALEAAAETRRLALRLEAEELLREEAALWPAGPQTSALLADWLERAGELAGQDEAVATLLGAEGGRLAEGRARLERLRACDAALEDGRWAEVHRSLVGTPAADLPPRYGLRPVELDEATGLWRLADLRTETDGTEPPLEFLLVPGLTLAGGELEPFFVARRPWSEGERRRLLGPDARPGLEPGARRTLDLARLGYRDPSSAEVALARRCGVELAPWSEQPVLPAIERR